MMERIIALAKKASPTLAEFFGLKPAFVSFLIVILGGIAAGIFNLNNTQREQNEYLQRQLAATNEIIKEINSKIVDHDKRIMVLETKVESNYTEMSTINLKTSDALARLETKLDMITYDVRQLNSYSRRK